MKKSFMWICVFGCPWVLYLCFFITQPPYKMTLSWRHNACGSLWGTRERFICWMRVSYLLRRLFPGRHRNWTDTLGLFLYLTLKLIIVGNANRWRHTTPFLWCIKEQNAIYQHLCQLAFRIAWINAEIYSNFLVKFPEFEPKEHPKCKRPTSLSEFELLVVCYSDGPDHSITDHLNSELLVCYSSHGYSNGQKSIG